MKKFAKRITPMALAICLMLTTIVGANAAAPIEPRGSAANAVFMRLKDYSLVMNAYTSGTPTNNTRVTLYGKDGTDTQKFYTKDHALYNAKTASYLVGINNSNSKAYFIPTSSSSSLYYVDVIPTGIGYTGYKFDLVSYGRYLGPYGIAQENDLYFKPYSDSANTIWLYES